jgi:hypothetical protein
MQVRAFCSVWVLLLYPSPSPSLSLSLPLSTSLLNVSVCLCALDALVLHARNTGGAAHGGQEGGLHRGAKHAKLLAEKEIDTVGNMRALSQERIETLELPPVVTEYMQRVKAGGEQ